MLDADTLPSTEAPVQREEKHRLRYREREEEEEQEREDRDRDSRREDKVRRRKEDKGGESMSIEETNALRAKLGLKPLQM